MVPKEFLSRNAQFGPPGVFQPRSHEFAARLVSAIWRTEEMPNRVIYRTIWGKCRNSSIEFVRFAHTPAGIEGDWMLKESWIGWAAELALPAWPTNLWDVPAWQEVRNRTPSAVPRGELQMSLHFRRKGERGIEVIAP